MPGAIRAGGRTLDFMVIGAQKAGTTALFRFLEGHPDLYLPPEKEAPFFTRPEFETRSLDWFVHSHFDQAPRDKLWGKVTPQYMADPRAPGRIAGLIPDVRLIAVLRDPVERTVSHHKMVLRRQQASSTLAESVAFLLTPEQVARSRTLPAGPRSEPHCLLAWSEYGRVLGGYLAHFSRDQMLVIFSEQLKSAPMEQLRRIYRFLGVREDYVPADPHRHYHVGGAQERLKLVGRLQRSGVGRMAGRLIPARTRRVLGYWLRQYNVRPDTREAVDSGDPDGKLRTELESFFLPDIRKLERDFQLEVPWSWVPHDRG